MIKFLNFEPTALITPLSQLHLTPFATENRERVYKVFDKGFTEVLHSFVSC